jgi:hypothetical protein
MIKKSFNFYNMQITLTHKESEEFFCNSLCNGLSYMVGYGLSIEYDRSQYKSSKDHLLTTGACVCYEDILMQILRDGGSLTLADDECDGEYTRSITLADVHERVQKTPAVHLLDMQNGNDDAITADVILQSVFYEDVIFG